MTELENKLAEKLLEKIDMDKLLDKIAEKAAELIIQKEYPNIPPNMPQNPFIPSKGIPMVAMYACNPTDFGTKPFSTTLINSKEYY